MKKQQILEKYCAALEREVMQLRLQNGLTNEVSKPQYTLNQIQTEWKIQDEATIKPIENAEDLRSFLLDWSKTDEIEEIRNHKSHVFVNDEIEITLRTDKDGYFENLRISSGCGNLLVLEMIPKTTKDVIDLINIVTKS